MIEPIREHSRFTPMRIILTTAEDPRVANPRFILGLRPFVIA